MLAAPPPEAHNGACDRWRARRKLICTELRAENQRLRKQVSELMGETGARKRPREEQALTQVDKDDALMFRTMADCAPVMIWYELIASVDFVPPMLTSRQGERYGRTVFLLQCTLVCIHRCGSLRHITPQLNLSQARV